MPETTHLDYPGHEFPYFAGRLSALLRLLLDELEQEYRQTPPLLQGRIRDARETLREYDAYVAASVREVTDPAAVH